MRRHSVNRSEKPTVSDGDYERHISRATASSGYFSFRRDFLKILRRIDGLFLQDLINHSKMPKTKLLVEGGLTYFLCTEKYLTNWGCEWTRDEQKKHLELLEGIHYIKKIRKGMPARRYVWIDHLAIEKAIDDALANPGSVKRPNWLAHKSAKHSAHKSATNKEVDKKEESVFKKTPRPRCGRVCGDKSLDGETQEVRQNTARRAPSTNGKPKTPSNTPWHHQAPEWTEIIIAAALKKGGEHLRIKNKHTFYGGFRPFLQRFNLTDEAFDEFLERYKNKDCRTKDGEPLYIRSLQQLEGIYPWLKALLYAKPQVNRNGKHDSNVLPPDNRW